MAEDQPPYASPDGSSVPGVHTSGGDAGGAAGPRLTADAIVGHLTDQARRTATAAKARRVVNEGDEPGVLDLGPLRELLTELMAELGKLRFRDRIVRALRQAADMIEAQPPGN